MDTLEKEIRGWFESWQSSTKSGDLKKVHSLIADDAVFLVPGEGRWDKKTFAAAVTMDPSQEQNLEYEGQSDIQEIRVFGNLAYLWTQIVFSLTPKGEGAPLKYAGHSLSILEKRDDGWVLIRDANTVRPVQE